MKDIVSDVLFQAAFLNKPIPVKERKIEFMWSNVLHKGVITLQEPNNILGQKTVVKVSDPFTTEFTFFGKCALGNCGPFTVTKIDM